MKRNEAWAGAAVAAAIALAGSTLGPEFAAVLVAGVALFLVGRRGCRVGLDEWIHALAERAAGAPRIAPGATLIAVAGADQIDEVPRLLANLVTVEGEIVILVIEDAGAQRSPARARLADASGARHGATVRRTIEAAAADAGRPITWMNAVGRDPVAVTREIARRIAARDVLAPWRRGCEEDPV